jgi:O-antigen ligase
MRRSRLGGVGLLLSSMCILGMLQVLPLPAAWVAALAPRVTELRQMSGAGQTQLTVSVAPGRTAGRWRQWVALTLLFLAASALPLTRLEAWGAIGVLVTVGMVQALVGIANTRWVFPDSSWSDVLLTHRATGTFANPNHFAGLIGMALPAILACYLAFPVIPTTGKTQLERWFRWIEQPRSWVRLVLALGVLFIVWAGVLSVSRAGIVCIAAGMLVFLVLAVQHERRLSMMLLLAVAIAAALGCAWWLSGRLIMMRLSDYSLDDRAMIWADTWRTTWASPWVGTGLGAYEVALLPFQRLALEGTRINHAHNDYLQLACELGLPAAVWAIAAVLALVLATARCAWSCSEFQERLLLAALAASMVVALARSVVDFDMQIPGSAAVTVLIAGVAAGAVQRIRGCGTSGTWRTVGALVPLWVSAIAMLALTSWREPMTELEAAWSSRIDVASQLAARAKLQELRLTGGIHHPVVHARLLAELQRHSPEHRQAQQRVVSALEAVCEAESLNARAHALLARELAADRSVELQRVKHHAQVALTLFPVGVEYAGIAALAVLERDATDAAMLDTILKLLAAYRSLKPSLVPQLVNVGLGAALLQRLPLDDRQSWELLARGSLIRRDLETAGHAYDQLHRVVIAADAPRRKLRFEARVLEGVERTLAVVRLDGRTVGHIVLNNSYQVFELEVPAGLSTRVDVLAAPMAYEVVQATGGVAVNTPATYVAAE